MWFSLLKAIRDLSAGPTPGTQKDADPLTRWPDQW